MFNPWDCPFNSPLSGWERGIFIVYVLTHVVRLCTGHVLSAGGASVGWLVYGRPHAIPVPSASQTQDSAQDPPDQLCLYSFFSGKRAYLQRGRGLLLFLRNGSRSTENSVLCNPEVAGYSQRCRRLSYYFRGAVLMSSVLFDTGPGTSSHTSWLKTYVNWQRGLSCVSSCFHMLPVMAFVTSMKLLGTATAHNKTRAFFIVVNYDFSRDFIY